MKNKLEPLSLPHLTIDFPVALGPMAGVTDLAGREIAAEFGCGLFYTEMVSAKALSYGNENTEELLKRGVKASPLGVQLFGNDPDVIACEAAKLEDRFDFIDFNMGCPVPKVVKNREGSYLLTEPDRVRAIFRKLVSTVHKPVTAKIRIGFGKNERQAPEIAKILEDCGVAMIGVHGRTREQYYSGEADYGAIRLVKQAVSIPVIGNGDVRSAADAERMLRETDVDGIMVARGADGNPWIFRELAAWNAGKAIPERPAPEEIVRTVLRHAELLAEDKGEHIAVREMRRHASAYLRGLPGASKKRVLLNTVSSIEELRAVLFEIEGG